MATQTYEAIFQNGAFRPVEPVSVELSEGQHVRLVIEVEEPDILEIATSVYDGLSDGEINEVEQIALDRRDFFGRAA